MTYIVIGITYNVMPRQNRTSYNDHLTCLNRYPLREIFQILLQSFTDQEQTALDSPYR